MSKPLEPDSNPFETQARAAPSERASDLEDRLRALAEVTTRTVGESWFALEQLQQALPETSVEHLEEALQILRWPVVSLGGKRAYLVSTRTFGLAPMDVTDFQPRDHARPKVYDTPQ